MRIVEVLAVFRLLRRRRRIEIAGISRYPAGLGVGTTARTISCSEPFHLCLDLLTYLTSPPSPSPSQPRRRLTLLAYCRFDFSGASTPDTHLSPTGGFNQRRGLRSLAILQTCQSRTLPDNQRQIAEETMTYQPAQGMRISAIHLPSDCVC